MVGKAIAHYRVTAKLGAGGMGEVYRAQDTRLGRSVAIKLLPTEVSNDAERIRRFQQEARAASALNHPHIVSIYDTGQENSTYFIVMELVEGQPLDVWAEHEKPELRHILEVMTQVVDALTTAHEAGLVHRDLKPANILVTPQGYTKVLDFGLAKLVEGAQPSDETESIARAKTGTGIVLGTAAYMSPEQALAKPLDGRSDIFSLGAVLYEAVTGKRAFPGTSGLDILHAIVHDTPTPVRNRNRLAPAELQWVLDKALAKDLSERYQTMREFAADLRRLRRLEAGVTATAEAPAAAVAASAARFGPWHKLIFWTTFVAAIAVIAIGTAWALRNLRAWPAAERARGFGEQAAIRQLTSYAGTERAGALSPDGKFFAFVSDKGGPPEIWVRQVSGGEPVQITRDAEDKGDLAYSPDGESIYYATVGEEKPIIWRIGALGGTPRRIVESACSPSPSLDGKRLAYLRVLEGRCRLWFRGAIEIANVDGTGAKRIHEGQAVRKISWSPDGKWIAFAEGGLFATRNVYVIDAEGKSKRGITNYTFGSVNSQAWLPDSQHLVISRIYGTSPIFGSIDLGIVSLNGTESRRLTLSVNNRYADPVLSADGKKLLATMGIAQDELWNVPLGPDPKANGAGAKLLLDSSWDPFWVHVSRDGKTVLFNSRASGNRDLYSMPADGSATPRQVTTLAGDVVTHCALSPDGQRVAYISLETGEAQVWVAGLDGSNPVQITHDAASHSWPNWSPDGKWVVYVTGRRGKGTNLWKAPSTGGQAVQVSEEQGLRADWIDTGKPGGNRIAVQMGRTVDVLDGETGKRLRRFEFPGEDWTWTAPVWHPDGRHFTAMREEGIKSRSIWVLDADTGERKLVAQFPGRFHPLFRVGWSPGQRSLIVHRNDINSHIVLLENFQ